VAAWRIWGALAILYVVWGSTYVAARAMVETIPPLLGAGTRCVLAGLAIAFGLRLRRGAGALPLVRSELLGAAAAGGLLIVGGQGLMTVGVQHLPAGLAALVGASVPLWLVLLRAGSGERPGRLTLIGVVVGFVGVTVLLLAREVQPGATAVGFLLCLLSAIAWAIGSFYSRAWSLPRDSFVSAAWQLVFGGALMLVLGLASGEVARLELADVSERSLAGFAWMVLAGSLLAFSAYVWLLANVPISTVATHAYVNPLVAIFLGWLLLSEQISPLTLLGALLIVASVFIVVSRETDPATP
jgi:drug/metabolite transporter (DMT)-like permease